MIVLTSINKTPRYLCPGDEFCMKVTDMMGAEVVIKETITVSKVIDFIAAFRFALDDGTCPGFHLTGIFGCQSELPKEMRDAVFIEDLSRDQYENFVRTVGIERHGSEPARMFEKFRIAEKSA